MITYHVHFLLRGQKKFKIGKSRLFYNVDEVSCLGIIAIPELQRFNFFFSSSSFTFSQEFPIIAAVSIGKKQLKQNDLECVNQRKENLRHAAAGIIIHF